MSIIQFMPSPFLDEDEIADPYQGNVIMDLRFDDINTPTVIKDSSFYQHVIARFGDTILKADQKKFGKSSCYFDGDWDYLNAPKHTVFNQQGDFTLELWFRMDVVRETTLIAHKSAAANWPPLIWVASNGSLIMHVVTNTTRISTPAGAVKANQWHHLSYGRVGRVWNMYLDGILCGTWLHNSADQAWGDWIFQLAAQPYGAFSFLKGSVDHLRWWKGVAIRDGVKNFSPPTAPWKKTESPTTGSLSFTALATKFELPTQFNKMEIELWGAGGGTGSTIATSIPEINMIANRGAGLGGTASGGDINYRGGGGGSGSMNACTGGSGGTAGKINGNYGRGATGERQWDGSGSEGGCRTANSGYGGGGYCQKTFTKAQLPTSLTLNVGQASGGGGSGLIILTWS